MDFALQQQAVQLHLIMQEAVGAYMLTSLSNYGNGFW